MNKKIMTIGIISMFLLTSLSVGTTLGEKITQEASDSVKDLSLELGFHSVNFGVITGTEARVTNIGTETVYGPVTVTLTIKKGFFGFKKYEEKTFTLLIEGQSMNLGVRIDLGDWGPDPSVNNGIYVFQYKLDYEDDKIDNNKDGVRILILNRHMWELFSPYI